MGDAARIDRTDLGPERGDPELAVKAAFSIAEPDVGREIGSAEVEQGIVIVKTCKAAAHAAAAITGPEGVAGEIGSTANDLFGQRKTGFKITSAPEIRKLNTNRAERADIGVVSQAERQSAGELGFFINGDGQDVALREES